jgi:hypothetical protein
MAKYLRNDRGAALVTVIVVMVVMSILGLALLNVSLAEAKHAIRQEQLSQAHYIAQAGVDAVAVFVRAFPSQVTAKITSGEVITGNLGIGTFSAVITGDIFSTVRITATGTTSTGASSVVYLDMQIDASGTNIFNNVVYSGTNVNFHQVTILPDDDGTYGTVQAAGSITITNPSGTPYPEELTKPYQKIVYPSPVIPSSLPAMGSIQIINGQNVDIDSHGEYSLIDIKNGGTLTFDASSVGVLHVVVNSLESNGDIHVTGGHVFLYIRNNMDITTSGGVNYGAGSDPNNLSVIMADGSTAYIQAGHHFGGYFYAPNASITLNSGNVGIDGGVIGNIVAVNNNAVLKWNEPDGGVNFSDSVLLFEKRYYGNP